MYNNMIDNTEGNVHACQHHICVCDHSSSFIKSNKKIIKSVHLLSLIWYFLWLAIKDKTTQMLYLSFIVFAVVFAIVARTQNNTISILNWYFILNIIFVILLSSRIISFYLHNKTQDQTLTIIVQQNTSRIRIFFGLIISSFIVLVVQQIIGSLLIVVINIDNKYAFLYMITNVLYQSITSLFLLSFIFFITIILKPQMVSIITSIILLSLFISNIPANNFINKMKNTTVTLKTRFEDVPSGHVIRTIEQINDTLEFNEKVRNAQIKYPNLSKYIYDNFIENDFIERQRFEDQNSVYMRLDMWDKIGLIDKEETPLFVNDSEEIELKIRNSKPREIGIPIEFQENAIVNLKLSFKNKFKSIDDIRIIQNDEYQNIIDDFVQFYDDWTTNFKILNPGNVIWTDNIDDEDELTFAAQFLNEIWKSKNSVVGDYLRLQIAGSEPINTNASQNTKITIEDKIIPTILHDFILSNYYSDINQNLRFWNDSESESEYTKKYKDLIVAYTNMMKTEIYSGVLEKYFIRQASNYNIYKNSKISESDPGWVEYNEYMDKNKLINYLLPTTNMTTYFADKAGKSWDQFWFKIDANSLIDFTTQNNYFFGESNARWMLDEYENPIKYEKPNIDIYIYIHMINLLITMVISILVFLRKDFK